MEKRILSIFLIAVLMLNCLPVSALAAQTSGETEQVVVQDTLLSDGTTPETEAETPEKEEPVAGWTWSLDGTVLTISGNGPMDDYAAKGPWSSDITEVIIKPGVTTIGARAFYNCKSLTKVTIPDSVTDIRTYAFYGCSVLTEAPIPDSVTAIGDYAFSGCTALTEVVIPDSVISIGQDAFNLCTGLTSVTIGEGVTSVGDGAFYNCINLTTVNFNAVNCDTMDNYYGEVFDYCNKLATVNIGENVTRIPIRAFYYCTSLTSVSMGNSLTDIEKYAFFGCTGLTEVSIPDSVTTISEGAFSGCTGLSSLSIPDSLVRVDRGAFAGCTLATTTYGNAKYLGNAENPYVALVSATSTSITSIEIHPDTVVILEKAFSGCTSLTAVTIPDNVRFIGQEAFYGCTKLVQVTLGASVTEIGENAFYNCYILAETHISSLEAWLQITFDDVYATPTVFAEKLYVGGELLTRLVIPETVKTIHAYAFYNLECITEVTIPQSVTWIGERAFYDCGIASVKIPEGVTELEPYVFAYCSNLAQVDLHDGITAIGSYAFNNCSLTELVLPVQVQSIGDYAFANNGNLAKIVLPEGLQTIGTKVFYNCPCLTELVIPDSVTQISEGALAGLSGLQSLTVPFVSVSEPSSNLSQKTYDPFGYFFGSNSYSNSVATEQNRNTVSAYSESVINTYAYTYYLPASLQEVTVTMEEIPLQSFYNCTGLTKITLPNVRRIGNQAFENCTGLVELSISDQVEIVGTDAFLCCDALPYTVCENGQYLGNTENPYATLVGVVDKTATTFQIHENVKSIANYALSDCTGLMQMTVPDGVIGIGKYAFYGCTGLTSLIIPDSVKSIGQHAFLNCSSLQSLTIPFADGFHSFFAYSDTEIPSSLTTVKVTGGAIPDSAFSNDNNIKSIILTDGVTAIGDEAFLSCTGLTSIVIPQSVKTIGDCAFKWCSNLTSVTISEGVTSIGKQAFWYCSKLTEVTVPESVTTIGAWAFESCTGLKTVELPSNLQEIGTSIFKGCTNITAMTFGKMDQRLMAYFDTTASSIPVTAVTIKSGIVPAGAFNGTTKVASVTLNEGVSAIGASAFQGCTAIKWISIPGSVTTIGASAFSGCTALQTVSLKDGIKTIGNQAFNSCTALKGINIPNSVTTIEASAFTGCTGLSYHVDGVGKYLGTDENPKYVLAAITDKTITSFNVSENTGIILDDVFKNCTKMIAVSIPNTVTSIGSSAFYNCTALSGITLPAGITTIYSNTFYGCKKLSAIAIPASISEIGLNAFSGCTGLTRVDISDLAAWCNIKFGSHQANPLYFAGNLYLNSRLLTKLEVPASVKTLRSSTFAGCTSLTEVIIPDTVETIEGAVFAVCSNLQSMTIPFVGMQKMDANTYPQYPFGYLFGTTSYTGSTVASQPYYNSSATTTSATYYIPNSLKSVTVTGGNINYGAFFGCVNLTSIDVSAAEGGVASRAFYNCKALTDLKLPSDFKTIGEYAFFGCLKLTEFTIPDTVTEIGDYAFALCSVLQKVTIPDGVTTIGSYAFSTCTSLTELTIPDSVTTIEAGVLYKCSGIRSLTIPFVGESRKTATETPQYPLGYLFGTASYTGGTLTKQYYYYSGTTSTTYSNYYIPTGLKTVTVTDGDLNYGAFYGCSNITEIHLGDGVLNVNPDAFIGTNGLEAFEVAEENPNYSSMYRILYNKDKTQIIWTPAKHTYILTVQYTYATGETAASTVVERHKAGVAYNVAVPEILGYSTQHDSVSGTMPMQDLVIDVIYYENSKLTGGQCTDTISWTLYQDGSLIFRGTGAMPDYTTGGAPWAEYADEVISVYIDSRITSIGAYAFENCRKMTFIDYGYSIKTIGQYAFSGCSSLASFKLPDSVTTISEGAFSSCVGLKSVVIPDRITYIAGNAFMECSELIQVTVGGNVTQIGDDAFANCGKLTQVYFRGEPVELGSNALGSTSNKYVYYYSTLDGWDEVITDGLWNGYTAVPYNAIAKEGFDGTNVYIIKVVDRYNTPLVGIEVKLGDATKYTNTDGMAYFVKPTEPKKLTVSDLNFNHITFEDASFSATTTQVMDIIELSDRPSVVQGVSFNGQSIATTVGVLNCAQPETVTITVNGYSKYTIVKYELYQGNRLIATNETSESSCTFQVASGAFEEGETVLARMYTADGNMVATALNIDVIKLAAIAKDQVIAELSDVNIDAVIGDLGNLRFELPFSVHGVDEIYVYTEGRSIFVGINLDVNELFSRKVSKKAIQKAIDSTVEALDSNASQSVEVKFCGYLEVVYRGKNDYYIKSSYVKMSVGLMLESELHASLYGIVGVYFKVKFGATGELELHISDFDPVEGFDVDQHDLTLKSMLDLEGGVFLLWGIGSAGVFGNLTMGFTVGMIPATEIKAVYITGDLGIRWKIAWGLFSGEYSFGPKDIYRWPEEAAVFMVRLYEAKQDPDSYTENDRSYLEDRSPWLSGTQEDGSLQENIYGNVAPKIVTCGDTTVMVWLDDNSQRDNANFQMLYYSVCKDGVWSEPMAVCDNGTFDCEFDVYTDGEKIYVIYTEMKDVCSAYQALDIADSESIEAFVTGVEVNVIVYEDGKFGAPVRLTDNNVCEQLPAITEVDSVLTATWLESNALGLGTETANGSVISVVLDATGWSEPAALASGQNTISDIATFALQGNTYTAYIVDADGDDSTTDDQTLVLRFENGDSIQLDTGKIANVMFTAIAGTPALTWYNDGKVYMISDVQQQPVSLVPESIAAGLDYQIVFCSEEKSLLLFTMKNYDQNGDAVDGTDIYGMYIDLNGAFGVPVRMTKTEGYITSYCVYAQNDALYAVFTETFANVTEDGVETTTHLRTAALEFRMDIAIENAEYDITQARPNSDFNIQFSVTNNGINTIDGLTLNFYDHLGQLLYNADCDVTVEAGASADFEVTVVLPQSICAEAYVVEILPMSKMTIAEDPDPTNNRVDLALAYADMSICAEQKIIGEKNYVIFSVANDGNMASTAMLNVYAEDRLISELEIDAIDPGATEQYLIDVHALTTEADNILTCTVASDFTDPYILNDTDSVYLLHIADEMLAIAPEEAIRNPELSINVAEFDKYAAKDITLQITAEADSFISIEGLTLNTDYTVDDATVTISRAYLAALDNGTHTLNFVFDFGNDSITTRSLTVTVSDSAPIVLTGSISISGEAVVGATVYADVSDLSVNTANVLYIWSVDGETVGTGSSYTIGSQDNGKMLKLTVTAADGYVGTFTAETAVTLQKPDAPTAPVVTRVDGASFTLVRAEGMEYSLDKETWQDSNVFNGLLPNKSYTVYARVKATDTSAVSEISTGTTVTTLKLIGQQAAAPEVESRTGFRIVLVAAPGMEYRIEGSDWTDNNVFTGLKPDTDYVFYQRYKETDTTYAGEASTATLRTAAGVSISGTVTGFGDADGEVTVRLLQGDTQTACIVTTDGTYTLTDILPGEYTLVVSKLHHETKACEITVGTEDLVYDVTIHFLGDADGNGYVDAYDASLIKKYSVGAISENDLYLSALDLDGDSYVDAYDASLIQKYSVGTIDKFPCED